MMNFFKENKKILLFFILLSIILPVIILTPSCIGFIRYETGLALIGYIGSILGGFLTLYGVWWTINEQHEIRKTDLSIQYKPYLSSPQPIAIDEDSLYIEAKGNDHVSFSKEIKLKNTGRGEALIMDSKVSCVSDKTKNINISSSIIDDYVDKNESLTVDILLEINYFKEVIKNQELIAYVVEVFYTDLFSKEQYIKKINIQLEKVSYTLSPESGIVNTEIRITIE